MPYAMHGYSGFVNLKKAAAFEQQVAKAQAAALGGFDEFLFELAVECFWRISRRTPVKTGRARGNWRVGLNHPDPFVDEEGFDPDGQAGLTEAREVLRNVRTGMTVYISNGLPYINRLEHGWSQKAPDGMVAVTAAEVPFIARQIAQGMAGKLHGRAGAGVAGETS